MSAELPGTWKLLAVAHPDFDGTIDEFVGPNSELGPIPSQAECFAGFVSINPDREARPLSDILGPAKDVLAAYRMEDWVATGARCRAAFLQGRDGRNRLRE